MNTVMPPDDPQNLFPGVTSILLELLNPYIVLYHLLSALRGTDLVGSPSLVTSLQEGRQPCCCV